MSDYHIMLPDSRNRIQQPEILHIIDACLQLRWIEVLYFHRSVLAFFFNAILVRY